MLKFGSSRPITIAPLALSISNSFLEAQTTKKFVYFKVWKQWCWFHLKAARCRFHTNKWQTVDFTWMRDFKDVDFTEKTAKCSFPLNATSTVSVRFTKQRDVDFTWKYEGEDVHFTEQGTQERVHYKTLRYFLQAWAQQQNKGLFSPKQANTVIVINIIITVVVVIIISIIKLEGCNWPLFIFHGNITGKDEGISYFFRHIRMTSSMIHYKPFDQAVGKDTHIVLNEIISTLFLVVNNIHQTKW